MRITPEPQQRTRIGKKHDAASNAAAIVTIAADTAEQWVIDKVHFSYNGDPGTSGRLTVQIGAVVEYDQDITKGGLGFIDFRTDQGNGLYRVVRNEAVVVTLAAGGVGITGKLTVQYR